MTGQTTERKRDHLYFPIRDRIPAQHLPKFAEKLSSFNISDPVTITKQDVNVPMIGLRQYIL